MSRSIKQEELNEIVKKHEAWLRSKKVKKEKSDEQGNI